MDLGETLTAVTAIIVGGWMLVQLFQYGARATRSLFGTSAGGDSSASLSQDEVEGMIRRAVREEVRQAVRPLREKMEHLEAPEAGHAAKDQRHFHDLSDDPHDFGLIAEGMDQSADVREEHAA